MNVKWCILSKTLEFSFLSRAGLFHIIFCRFSSRRFGGGEIRQHVRPCLQMGRCPNLCASGSDDVSGYLKKHIEISFNSIRNMVHARADDAIGCRIPIGHIGSYNLQRRAHHIASQTLIRVEQKQTLISLITGVKGLVSGRIRIAMMLSEILEALHDEV